MTGRLRKLLLIEDDATDARLIRGALADARGGPFEVHWVRKISDGIEFLRTDVVGAIFADLFLAGQSWHRNAGTPVSGCASNSDRRLMWC